MKQLTIISTVLFLSIGAISGQSLKPDKKQKAGLEFISKNQEKYNQWLVEIGGIISPSGKEQGRAASVASKMKAIGLQDVIVDDEPNAIGIIPGEIDSAIVFISTLDDLAGVAEHQKAQNAPPIVEGNRVIGPGTNTSSITISILAAAEAIIKQSIKPYYTLVFAAVAQEETGLVGMKSVFNDYKDQSILFVDVLGDGHRLSYGALGIHWWKVFANGPAGHTLRSGWPGQPHVNQAIGRAVDRILTLPQPNETRERVTRINVGMIESGNVFNHKPERGYFTLDIRSLDENIILDIEADVRKILDGVEAETGVTFELEPFQIMPGGQIEGFENGRLLGKAKAISSFLGYEADLSNAGSSNMNVALSQGKKAIGLGGSRGGNRGFPDEYADSDAMIRSAQHVFLIGTSWP